MPAEVVIDFSDVSFITPPSVAFLSNFTYWFANAGAKVAFDGLNVNRAAIKYLDDSMFFEQHLGSKLDPSSYCRSTTVPVRKVAKTDSYGWLEFEFIPWLSEKSGLSKASLAEVKTCLQELFNNISDHTVHDEGCVFGQWYPNINKIIVSIGDFGIGIPQNVERVVPNLSDNGAILKAAEDGFSTKSLPTNRGAGLHLLLLNVVQRFCGTVTIRSHAGYVEFVNHEGKIYSVEYESCGFCIGTTIDLVLYTDRIPHADDEEEFEWF
ncbi:MULTISPECIES: ATP-binding protein [unclassified Mameliella]|uniref:ATP-binding protein n=1 Tax=unclassified Mameliella TaxID=2630630 RepID=UPI00273DEC5C|nr:MULTISPECIES: ATP-binding protein [unclassified Mameliella]